MKSHARRHSLLAFVFFLLALASPMEATEIPLIVTVAGGGPNGLPAEQSSINQPQGVAVNAAGDLFISSAYDHRVFVRKKSSGRLFVAVGTGYQGCSGDGGAGTSAEISIPLGMAVDARGNLFIADGGCVRIWRLDALTGILTTYAGTGQFGFSGDGGPATSALLGNPQDVDSKGNVYIADFFNWRARRVDSRTRFITTVAGNGHRGNSGDGGPATLASITGPIAIVVARDRDIFIGDRDNSLIRRVDSSTGVITSLPGLFSIQDLTMDSKGELYLTSALLPLVSRVDLGTGMLTRIIGPDAPVCTGDGEPAATACLDLPSRSAISQTGSLYIAEMGRSRVRSVDPISGLISTVAGNGTASMSADGITATLTTLGDPQAVRVDADGNILIVDTGNNRIRRVDSMTGIITTIAGGGPLQFPCPDGVSATNSCVAAPHDAILDGSGNLLISEGFAEGRVRRVDAITGTISTVAGGGYGGDGIPATYTLLAFPSALALDTDGSLFVAEQYYFNVGRVRRVDSGTGLISIYAGGGTGGDGDPAVEAELHYPAALVLDEAGDLLIGSAAGVKQVDAATGIITTVAGGGTGDDGGPATMAALFRTNGLAFDAAADLLLADSYGGRIRRVDHSTQIISTIAGLGGHGYRGDGGPALGAGLEYPQGIALDSNGDLLVADTFNQRIRKVLLSSSFSLLTPPRSAAFAVPMRPPTFRWASGGLSEFRVEFSNDPVAFSHSLVSSKKLQTQTTYTPTTKGWKKILNLAKGGRTVYWRVVGQASSSTAILPSDQVFSFTYEP